MKYIQKYSQNINIIMVAKAPYIEKLLKIRTQIAKPILKRYQLTAQIIQPGSWLKNVRCLFGKTANKNVNTITRNIKTIILLNNGRIPTM